MGLVELTSLALGYQAADAMVKAAAVRLVAAGPTSPGKYLAAVIGDVASVQAAVAAGAVAGGSAVLDQLVIANLHGQVREALMGQAAPAEVGALGVVECATVAAAIRGADAAVKAAAVALVEMRLARGLGGKAYFSCTGDVASVQAAVAAGRAEAERAGAWLADVVIAAPHPELKGYLGRSGPAALLAAMPGPGAAGAPGAVADR